MAANGQHLRTGLLAIGVGLVVALGHVLSVCFEGRLPQAPGEDVVALVLGDARLEISRALEDKAEEYFHGGVRNLNCTMQSDAKAHERDDIGHGQQDDDGDHDEAHGAVPLAKSDPWLWIDGRVHQQTHRHLQGNQTAELLPWLWAATRMSPQNRQAYESGAYVLAYLLERPNEAVKLLEEGVRKSPACPELDFSLGEIWFNKLHDPAHAEPCFVSAREKCLPAQKDKARAEELTLLRLRSLFYLGYIAKQRGDLDRVRRCLEEAEALSPKHSVVRNLRDLLETSGTAR